MSFRERETENELLLAGVSAQSLSDLIGLSSCLNRLYFPVDICIIVPYVIEGGI